MIEKQGYLGGISWPAMQLVSPYWKWTHFGCKREISFSGHGSRASLFKNRPGSGLSFLPDAFMMTVRERDHTNPRGLILAALMCTIVMAAMDTTIVATAVPQIVADLGGFRLFSWVFSIYLLAQTVTIPTCGKLSDLFGRKPVLIIGTFVFLVCSAALSLSWNMVSLIVFPGIQGLGAGAIIATVSTLAGDLYSVRKRAAVQGWLSSVWGIAAILGPVLGGALAEYVYGAGYFWLMCPSAHWHWR